MEEQGFEQQRLSQSQRSPILSDWKNVCERWCPLKPHSSVQIQSIHIGITGTCRCLRKSSIEMGLSEIQNLLQLYKFLMQAAIEGDRDSSPGLTQSLRKRLEGNFSLINIKTVAMKRSISMLMIQCRAARKARAHGPEPIEQSFVQQLHRLLWPSSNCKTGNRWAASSTSATIFDTICTHFKPAQAGLHLRCPSEVVYPAQNDIQGTGPIPKQLGQSIANGLVGSVVITNTSTAWPDLNLTPQCLVVLLRTTCRMTVSPWPPTAFVHPPSRLWQEIQLIQVMLAGACHFAVLNNLMHIPKQCLLPGVFLGFFLGWPDTFAVARRWHNLCMSDSLRTMMIKAIASAILGLQLLRGHASGHTPPAALLSHPWLHAMKLERKRVVQNSPNALCLRSHAQPRFHHELSRHGSPALHVSL